MDIFSYLLGKQAGGGSGGGDNLNDYLNLEITSNINDSNDNFYTRLLTNKQPLKPTIASNVTQLNNAFYNYSGNLDLSNCDFSNIESCTSMFYGYRGTTVIFNNNELPLVHSLETWFNNSKITNIDLKIKVSSLTSLAGFFTGASVVSANLSNFDISENQYAIGCRSMFRNCSHLENITFGDFSKFNPAKLNSTSTSINNMFYGCTSLSNDSLNNILALCSRMNSASTLANIGLTSDQATTCTGLSNWAAASAAGWTTGY